MEAIGVFELSLWNLRSFLIFWEFAFESGSLLECPIAELEFTIGADYDFGSCFEENKKNIQLLCGFLKSIYFVYCELSLNMADDKF